MKLYAVGITAVVFSFLAVGAAHSSSASQGAVSAPVDEELVPRVNLQGLMEESDETLPAGMSSSANSVPELLMEAQSSQGGEINRSPAVLPPAPQQLDAAKEQGFVYYEYSDQIPNSAPEADQR